MLTSNDLNLLHVKSFIDGPTHVIQFSSVSRTPKQKQQEESKFELAQPPGEVSAILKQVSIELKNFGFSLISNMAGSQPKELMYLQVQGFKFVMLEKKNITSFQVRLQTLNIDNNTQYLTPFPVIFTPTKQQEIFKKNLNFFDCLIEMRNDTKDVNLPAY